MRTLLFFLCFIGFTIHTYAQKIQVLSLETQQPISGVAVYNSEKTKTGITDFEGFVDISAFTSDEAINFQHIGHLGATFTKSDIDAYANRILLQILPSTLDEIILSVSKFGQRKRDIPQQIVTVTSDDMRFRNPQTAADLLESSGQVYVQKSQLGGGSPLIRGFSTNRLLITVDGVRFNTAIFRGGNVQNVISIDPFSIRSRLGGIRK